MTSFYATDVVPLSEARRWTRSRLIHEMRREAGELRPRFSPPGDESVRRMIRDWNAGKRGLGREYAAIFTAIFGVPFLPGKAPASQPDSHDAASGSVDDGNVGDDAMGDLASRLALAATVDMEMVTLFESQTESYRKLDRRLGAAHLLTQTEAHVAQMRTLLTYSLPSECRSGLAAALAEAAALAGWQALDLGDAGRAWLLHETAKAAARDSESPAILAHVTAQQAYALIDLGRAKEACALVGRARSDAAGRVPDLLMAWLWAAEAEALAAAGAERQSRAALDRAAQVLPNAPDDAELPFVFLNDAHLARWRGNCLARLGAKEAVEDLTEALRVLDPTFARAAAGLRCDLALAYSVRGQHEEARAEARHAQDLADRMASARQRRRISRLLKSGLDHPGG